MTPWELLDRADVPDNGGELRLLKRNEEYSIRTTAIELMNSRAHGSEDALADLACDRIAGRENPRILIGGLGMGYTLAAALKRLDNHGRVVVGELVPAVVTWNRKHFGHLAGHPLEDPRASVREGDVARVIKEKQNAWDAILMDVDNGPEGLTRKANDWLYGKGGLKTAFAALRPSGILAVWSSSANDAFTRRLKQAGFKVEVVCVRARNSKKGGRHTIWLARRS